MVSFVKVHT